MRAYKEIIRKYYKTYIQPTNPTGISATSGWSNATNAFDNNDSTYATCNSLTDYIEWNIGEDIVLTGVNTVGNWVSGQAVATSFIVKSVEADGTEKTILSTIGASNTSTYYTKGDCSPVLVNKLRFYIKSTYPNAPSRTVQINLNTIPKESTEDDYDFYKDVAVYKVPKEIIRKYYKYVDTTAESIPSYSSATEATVGKNNVKIIDNPDTYAIYGVTTTYRHYPFYPDTATTTIDLGSLCKLINFSYKAYGEAGYSYDAGLQSIDGSQDNVNWTRLYSGSYTSTSLNQNYDDMSNKYRYLKLVFKHYPAEVGIQRACVGYFNTSFIRTISVESTKDDYDYYIDTPTYYGINQ